MFQHCLICTDFSDGLYRLVDFVPSLAAGGLKKIIFCHFVALWEEGEIPRIDEEGIEQARQRFEKCLTNIPEGVEVQIEVSSGRPSDSIPKIAKRYHADVILIGTPVRSLLQEKLFGSTTATLSKECSTPLLMLRPQLISAYTCEELDLRCKHLFRYLLIPYDGTTASQSVVERVKEYAKQAPDDSLKQCMLLWVVSEGGRRELSKEPQLQKAQDKLEPVKAELEELGLQVNTDVRVGNPREEILDTALEYDITAIAISSDQKGKFLDWSVRSLAGDLMRSSWHPVLFLPPRS
ncbi:universal stress protein UspA-like protein [Moorena producens PAL-8-15-08-1]|uniref:Universal stress protein UspA-like protein n=1 Tax=Moorena producens PAL-8-15-08-1 TaxID=1458985 RepID=A0A1D8TRK5_9CYAN|nr:universal stress protein [Moorena producens]AOX00245.1 universal stress protein UspA-like protein [Moorena producens PAL-8-15-08-1]